MAFYSVNNPLSYNPYELFCMGERRHGKSFNWVHFFLKKPLTYILNNKLEDKEQAKKQFIFIRRYDTELSISEFLGAIYEIIDSEDKGKFYRKNRIFKKDISIKVVDKIARIYYKSHQIGLYHCLSKAQYIKSNISNIVNYSYLVFEECLIMKGQPLHYLPNEVNLFNELKATFTKFNGTACVHELELIVLIANCMSFNNPYFIAWNIPVFEGEFYVQKFKNKNNENVVRLIQNDKFDDDLEEAKKSSKFGAVNQNTAYGDYFINNESLAENKDFIIEKFNGYGVYNFYYKRQLLTLYTNNQYFYFSNKVNKTLKTYYITREDNTINTLSFFGNKYLKDALKNAYQQGAIYYNNMIIKSLVYEIFNILNID